MGESAQFVHMLNGTLCATTRVICCLLETHQTEVSFVLSRVLSCEMLHVIALTSQIILSGAAKKYFFRNASVVILSLMVSFGPFSEHFCVPFTHLAAVEFIQI